MRAAVTGARGFVGPHLVAHLEAMGDDVFALDRSGPERFDVTDADAVRDTLSAIRPDALYHLAALSHVGESWEAPNLTIRVNVEGTLNVLRACADAGVTRVVVVGSAEQYGRVRPEDVPLPEDAPMRPVTPYGASKVAADVLALQAFLADGLPTIRARPFNHTGPGQTDRFLVPALARRIASAEHAGASEVVVGSLDPVRDVTDVRDVVRAYRLLALHGTPGEAYNVCRGTGVAVAEIAALLVERARRPLEVRVDPALVRPVEVPRLIGDGTRLRDDTGWAPEIPLARTLDDVLDEARTRVASPRSG
ncbi:MAG: GDP-mannose 4,6-dehydratase [Acidimicrobiia bacterium]